MSDLFFLRMWNNTLSQNFLKKIATFFLFPTITFGKDEKCDINVIFLTVYAETLSMFYTIFIRNEQKAIK